VHVVWGEANIHRQPKGSGAWRMGGSLTRCKELVGHHMLRNMSKEQGVDHEVKDVVRGNRQDATVRP